VTALVRRYPAISLFVLAVIFGTAPIVPVAAGWLPPGFDQLSALSASLAGIVLAAVLGGRSGVMALLKRGAIWRVGAGWWLFVLLFPAIPTLAALFLGGALGGNRVGLTGIGTPLGLIGTIAFLTVFAGLGEEFGWRGFALPRLQARHSALAASLIVGVLHWLWHTPLFFVKGVSQYDFAQQIGFVPAFLGYGLFVVGSAVQLTWIFNNTGGSVLMVAVYHGALNGWNGYIDIMRAGMPAAFAYTGLMVAVSAILVILFGARDLSRVAGRLQSEPEASDRQAIGRP
jgi:membrane protease YdiL (CAAX protease family)